MHILILFAQIFGWIVIALSTIFVTLLFPPIRRELKKISLSGDSCKNACIQKKAADFYETYLHSFVIVRQILLFLIPTAISIVVPTGVSIISEYFLSLIVLGISFVIFVSIQLPLLMKAHILVSFKIDCEKQGSRLNFRSGKTTYVEAIIHNLGFSTYKNSMIIFYFGKDFEIVPLRDTLYNDLDFKKEFTIQKRLGGVAFSPKDNFLTIPPQEDCVFPMWLKVPDKEEERDMSTLFYSENTWGMNRIRRRFSIGK